MALEYESQPWMFRSRCYGVDPNLFIPSRGQSIEPALAVCNGGSFEDRRSKEVMTFQGACPVKTECRQYQAQKNEMGVWGGEFFPSKDWQAVDEATEVAVVVQLQDARPRPPK